MPEKPIKVYNGPRAYVQRMRSPNKPLQLPSTREEPAAVAPQVKDSGSPAAQPVAETLTKTAAYTLVEAAGLTKDQLSAALDAGQVYGAVAGANKSYNVPRASLLAWIAATGGDVTAAEAV